LARPAGKQAPIGRVPYPNGVVQRDRRQPCSIRAETDSHDPLEMTRQREKRPAAADVQHDRAVRRAPRCQAPPVRTEARRLGARHTDAMLLNKHRVAPPPPVLPLESALLNPTRLLRSLTVQQALEH